MHPFFSENMNKLDITSDGNTTNLKVNTTNKT